MEQMVEAEMEENELNADDWKTYSALLAKQKARASKLLDNMKAAISSTLVR